MTTDKQVAGREAESPSKIAASRTENDTRSPERTGGATDEKEILKIQRGCIGALIGIGPAAQTNAGLIIFFVLAIVLLMILFIPMQPPVDRNITTAIFSAMTAVIGYLFGAKA